MNLNSDAGMLLPPMRVCSSQRSEEARPVQDAGGVLLSLSLASSSTRYGILFDRSCVSVHNTQRTIDRARDRSKRLQVAKPPRVYGVWRANCFIATR